MCKNRDEARVLGRRGGEVGISRVAWQKDGLGGLRTAVRLNPKAIGAIQRPGPEADLPGSEGGIWQFQHDAAYVFVGKVVSAAEPETVEGADGIKEERIASPAGKEKRSEERRVGKEGR